MCVYILCVFVCVRESNVINYVQVSICLRYVDPQTLQVHEDCIGLYATDRTDASTIAKLILDLLVRFNLPVKNCRGQCYDGAANMAGRRAGVAAKIKEVGPRALYRVLPTLVGSGRVQPPLLTERPVLTFLRPVHTF